MSLSDSYNKTEESKLIIPKIIQDFTRPFKSSQWDSETNKEMYMEYRWKQITREDLELDMAEHQSPYEASMVEVSDGVWQLRDQQGRLVKSEFIFEVKILLK